MTKQSTAAEWKLRAETFERQYRQACQDHASAMDEVKRLRAALMDIATDEKVYLGHGNFDEGPLPNDYCQKLARRALKPHGNAVGEQASERDK